MNENDFLKELEYLGLMSRIKRLSDTLNQSVRDLYRAEGLDIEPGWHLVFLLLKKHKSRTISEMSISFGMSQPGVVKIINRMKHQGYLDIVNDQFDNRKRQVHLSQKALREMPRFEKIWMAGADTVKEILGGDDSLLSILGKVELQLLENSFAEHAHERLNKG